ncbi:MAG TPA: dockerin type I domain-containing protein, partial [Thermoguttaceae bacterium]|nr:dockerin type I domain-containing protein [Thermoguttaceae bacterium]
EEGFDAFPGDHRNLPATYSPTSTNPADYADARGVIASWEHKQAGINLGLTYGSFTNHAPNSLADFLLTNNGDTKRENMAHGFEAFGSWDDPRTFAIESQRFTTQTVKVADGWSYADYCAEIDAGRPVHLGWRSPLYGHSVLGVGYNNTGGKENVVLQTTWHGGLQEWQWNNETVSGYGFSMEAATLMDAVSDPTPQLSAYVSIAHTYIRDLAVTIGIGSPSSPTWSTDVWINGGSLTEDNLVLTDIDCTSVLSQFLNGETDWFLKVFDRQSPQYGTIEDFQIRYACDEMVYDWDLEPVDIPTRVDTYAYLTTTPLVPGDATGDGMVNELDAARLSTFWGSSDATWRMGDFNGDDVVGAADASILAANWGFVWGGGEAEAAAPVPEPGVAVLLVGLSAACLVRPNRRDRSK